ncbi:hypothetical protein LJR118_003441 [Acidovorax sp. LjRoot118]|uniref:hypothetical protein n=1 Tax=Acidovorax sp. LjRoot118 TaxID=3342256 RepID=UPI003ED10676
MLSSLQIAKPSPATCVVLFLINLLGFFLCLGAITLLRSPWHSPAMLLSQLAAVAFVLALCAAALGGGPGRLLALAGAANVLVLVGALGLAAWELAKAAPWQSAAGFAAMAGAIPAINTVWWLLSRQRIVALPGHFKS